MSPPSTEPPNVAHLASALAHGIPVERELAEALQQQAQSRGIQSLSLRPGAAGATNPAQPQARDALDTNDLDDHEFLAGDDETEGVQGIETIDMLGETVRLFRQTKRLLSRVLIDTKTPVNQKAQVAGTLSTLLKQLTVQQTDLYNSERLKRLEAIVIRMVRDLPEEHQVKFLADYEREVNELR